MATVPPWEKFPTKEQVDADAEKRDFEMSIRHPAARGSKRLETLQPTANDTASEVEEDHGSGH